MSRWWRAYDEAVDDPKLCLLSDKQHRAWFNLCCITSQNGGKLPPITAVAFKLRMTVPKAKSLVAELVALGLVDVGDDGCAPHNWNARQFKSDVTDPTAPLRQKAYRDRIKDRNATVTDTATRTDTEQRQNAAPAAPDPEVELFRRGKEVLGKTSGGLIKQLLDAKDGKTNLARAAIETAAGKENPREYVGKIIRNQDLPLGEVSRFVDGRL